MKILSPMATGNGAYIIHQTLSKRIKEYQLRPYNPYWTLFPPALYGIGPGKDADLIHTTADYALFFKRKEIPLVISFQNMILDSFMEQYSSFLQKIHYKTDLRYFTDRALSLAAAVVSVSKFTAESVKAELGYTGKQEVIYNGVDCAMFRPAARTIYKKVKVLFSGNLTRRKGADLLPAIADRLDPGIEILYTSGLRTKNGVKGSDRLQSIGSIPFSEMPQVYQQADILLFPTVREGLPLAVLEAMASGLPVVASDCSSLPELIIPGKGGFLCTLGNAGEFAARLNELAGSSESRRQMGEFNRVRVEKKFTVELMVKEYRQLFEKVLAKS